REALDALRETKTPWERVRPGRTFRLDGVQLTVLAPDSSWTASQRDANETSVVLRVDYGLHRLLLTGDAEAEEEAWLVAQQGVGALDVDVLKLGHHGSRTSSTATLLDAATPLLAIASVGAGNRYGHPSPETLAALMARGVPVFRTDTDGTVIVQTDGRTLQVMAGGEQWQIPQEDRVP
ncbi:MAG: ComEC/Rec2 family competence protein, partial [Gemmatimonas sp.]